MAYESLLTVSPILSGSPIGLIVNSGVDGTLFLTTSGTTLGAKTPDLVAKLIFLTDPDSTGAGLSASAGLTSINLTLSSASSLTTPQVWPGQIQPGSTYKQGVSSTFTLYWPPQAGIASSLWNTVISLSSNANTIVLDPTKTSALDNFFYFTNSPDINHQVRTTYSQSRLASYLG
jgi:hypothetical protein